MMRFAMDVSKAIRLSFTCRIRFPPILLTTVIVRIHHKAKLRQMLADFIFAGDFSNGDRLADCGHCQRNQCRPPLPGKCRACVRTEVS